MRSSFFATAALLFVGLVSSARAQTQAIPYQGKLFQDGRPANGSYDLRYSLFNSETLPTPVATLDQAAQGVTNGFFSTALDFGPLGVVWDGRDYWLEVLVRTNNSTAGFESLGGRRALLPVPYALFAGKAGELVGMVGNAKLASGIDAGKITTGDLAAARLSVGTGHTLTGVGASIAGGQQNTVSGDYSFLGGGFGNTNSGQGSFLGGGYGNTVSGVLSLLGGGDRNTVSGPYSFLGGGQLNTSSGNHSFLGAGALNTASGNESFLGGGSDNTASGGYSFLGGGYGNTNSGDYSFLGAGYGNTNGGYYSFLGGGSGNTNSGNYSFLGGGQVNTASGLRSMVLGGERNKAQGITSFAAGTRAEALHDGAFVWADSTDAVFPSTVANEFAVRATGGFRLVAAVDGDGVPTHVLTYDASGLFINGVPVAMQGLIPTSTRIPGANVTSPKLPASVGASGTIADGSVTAEARIQTLEKQNASLEARVAALEALVKSAAQK